MQLTDVPDLQTQCGPLSRQQARELQRKRIVDALVREAGERGLRSVTIGGVSARAGVSRSTFYELFNDLEICICTVLSRLATRSTALMSSAFAKEAHWQDGVLAALAALLESLDRDPVLARVCLVETLAGSPAVLTHRARELASLNPLLDVGREQAHATGTQPELTAEASIASVAGILHTRLVTGEAPPFIGLLGQLVGLVVAPYLDPCAVIDQIRKGEEMACAIVRDRPAEPSMPDVAEQVPAALRRPGAYRARACVIFIAANPGASNNTVAAGIGVSHLGQVSQLLARLARIGLLIKNSGGAGRPNAWWPTPHCQQVARALSSR